MSHGAGVGLILGLIILILVPFIPFTEQFARESVPRSRWTSPTFEKINLGLSAARGPCALWGAFACVARLRRGRA
jgi:hypothetical protein